jgi:hypothetical protein
MERETSDLRQERGVQQLAAAITYWLARGLSQDRMASLVHWAYGETTGFDGGSFSRIKNAKQSRGAGLRHLDALAETNRAIWTWQTKSEREAIREFGLYSEHGIRPEWVTDTIWLPKPSDPAHPLDLGDFANLLMGRLELPYVGGHLTQTQAKRANERLVDLLDDLAAEQGWGPREALREFLAAYPASSSNVRQARLKELLMGEPLSHKELESELAALAEMVRQVRRLDTFTPAQLQAELLTDRRLRS